MKKQFIAALASITLMSTALGQGSDQDQPSIHRIPKPLLSGEGLDKIQQSDTSRTAFQKKVYDGSTIAIYIVAIGTGITNEFQNFRMEEFIYWMNGKAIVEPVGAQPFPIYTGDYFIQAKGFKGKWNFVDIGGVHLELALIAKNRPDSTFKSPMSQAMVLDRELLSGVSVPPNGNIYKGPELTVNLITNAAQLDGKSPERMLHVLNGVLTVTINQAPEQQFYPGDFFVLSEGFQGTWRSNSLQKLRVLEVYKSTD